MKRAFFPWVAVVALSFGGVACSAAAEDAPLAAESDEGNLVEGEEIVDHVVEWQESKDAKATGVARWDMLAIQKDGKSYYVFAGYNDNGRSPENGIVEMIFERLPDGMRLEPRGPDGKPMTLEVERSKAILRDIEAILETNAAKKSEAAKADSEAAKAEAARCGKRVSVPRMALLIAVRVVSGIGCATALFIPVVGVPSCAVWVASMINPFDYGKVKPEGCK